MKNIKICIILCFVAFGLQAQKSTKDRKHLIKISVPEISLQNALEVIYEKHIKQNQSLEVGLSIPLGYRKDLFPFRGEWFTNRADIKETRMSIGYKFYQNKRGAKRADYKRFQGFYFKPELYFGMASKKYIERSTCLLFCSNEPKEEQSKRHFIGGVMIHFGKQWILKENFSLEASIGTGYGFGHSFGTRYDVDSKSGGMFNGNLTLGYSF